MRGYKQENPGYSLLYPNENFSVLGTSGFKLGLYYGPGVPRIVLGSLTNLDSRPILVEADRVFLKWSASIASNS